MVILPLLLVVGSYAAQPWLRHKERKLELQVRLAMAETARSKAMATTELEARMRVLEKIDTDGGYDTAAKIEALRGRPTLPQGDKVQ